MKTPKPINLKAEVPAMPENVSFYKLISNKLDNGSSRSICFNDVLFCEKSEINETQIYILIKATGNKIGLIKSIDEAGNFTLESMKSDKALFPDYELNISSFDEIYKLVSLSRDQPSVTEFSEDWDDFDDVKEWEPETLEDKLTFRHNISKYLENQQF